MQSEKPFLAIDSGTTNTRVWLVRAGTVLAKAQVQAGVRDTARTGSLAFLKAGIKRAIDQVLQQSGAHLPPFALAAGMITSGLGLLELPHASAPAGWQDLAAQVARETFPDLDGLTIYFVRGVRSGPPSYTLAEAPAVDIIRGEETEVFGALETLSLNGPLLYVHLGSHSKLIHIDAEKRIAGGMTTLTGELIHAVQAQTILSSALPAEGGERFHMDLVRQGAEWTAQYGLSRTLFLVRILEQSRQYSPDQLWSVFIGAVAFTDIQALRSSSLAAEQRGQVVLSGRPSWQPVWRSFLEEEGFSVIVLSPQEMETAFLKGLQRIVFASPLFRQEAG
ncbi:MAG: 2-dehydro-3-deoxygalactonokinase [Nitrospinota bacterium]|nr:MAG: 2-dehydro-3-deoxygalactonokinase [Nitrospinota bacterium]